MAGGWIGVDFDGTLAHWDGWSGDELGEPVQPMLDRVKGWLKDGREVKIVTARAAHPKMVRAIKDWCKEHLGQELEVTDRKDFAMEELWDDRAIQVMRNVGEPVVDVDQVAKKLRGLLAPVMDKRRVR